MNKELINLVDISKAFDGETVLDELNLNIHENEFLTLLGPSGCGKTTTLRILGGFVTPDKGRVIFDGKDITNLPPNKRQLNTVFQKYALFSHMNIAENIAFGLKIRKKSKGNIFRDRHMGKEGVLLKYGVQLPLVGGQIGNVSAVKDDITGIRRLESADNS